MTDTLKSIIILIIMILIMGIGIKSAVNKFKEKKYITSIKIIVLSIIATIAAIYIFLIRTNTMQIIL